MVFTYIGDVFGVYEDKAAVQEEQVDKDYRWGSIAVAVEEESEEEDEEEESYDANQQTSGTATPATQEGISSIVSGLETPDTIDLRKRVGIETPDIEAPKELYHVVKEKHADAANQLFGSDRTYVLPGSSDNKRESEVSSEEEERKKKAKVEASATSTAAKKLKDFKF
jgi:splicing factor 3B subunit 2